MASSISPRPPWQASPSIAGTWIGIYQVYPEYIQLTLTISGEPSASQDAQAEIRVEGLNGRNAPQMGVVPAVVRFQADVRTLDITATRSRPAGTSFGGGGGASADALRKWASRLTTE